MTESDYTAALDRIEQLDTLLTEVDKYEEQAYPIAALCGMFRSDATEEQLVEEYLQEKYKL